MNKPFPNHIAIIPDGNRRWARARGLPALEGHRKGMEVSIKIARFLRKIGVHTFTLWGFSTENWGRGKKEITGIFALGKILDSYVKEALENRVRIVHLGRKDRISDSLLKRIVNAEQKTAHLEKHILNIAFDYGGRDEIIRAIGKMRDERSEMKDINEQEFDQFLDTAGQPYPNSDIIIRTGGEIRTSGFMPWQSAYSEYFFIDKYFPDLSESDIENVLTEYADRKRRFGK